MKIDLHIHSTYSDGEYEPLELLKLGKEKGVTTLAITDHDTLDGSKIAYEDNPYSDLQVIPGIELNAYYPKGQLHILGYGLSFENAQLNALLKEMRYKNMKKLEELIFQVERTFDIAFRPNDIEKLLNQKGNIGRPHFAKLCIEYGYVSSVKEAFKILFNPVQDKVKAKKMNLLDSECLQILHQAGAKVSIAHLNTLKKSDEEIEKYLKSLQKYGLDAIEGYHSSYTQEQMIHYQEIAKRLGLELSGGTDFHGPIVKPNIEIATGKNNNVNIQSLSILQGGI